MVMSSRSSCPTCPGRMINPLCSEGTGIKTAGNHDLINITADEAFQRLIDGNERFHRGEACSFFEQRAIFRDLTRGQRPYATILGCSDSRVPPELIFDAGLGELFVVRVAGNVISPEIAGSLQYAGAHLKTPLLVVLGHEGCGAVQAAMETKYRNVQQRSRIQLLVESLLPALPNPILSFLRRRSWRRLLKVMSAGPCARYWNHPKVRPAWRRG